MIPKELKKQKYQKQFEQVRDLMKMGHTRTSACDYLSINRKTLYGNLTGLQKRELDEIYFSFSNGSTKTKWAVEHEI